LWSKNYALEVEVDQQKLCAIGQNTHFCVSFIVFQFSFQVASKPRGMMSQFWYGFSAFIVDKSLVFVCRYFEPFRS